MIKIYLGADHGGYELKEEIKNWLAEAQYEVEDLGAFRLDAEDDYPDFALPVVQKVAGEKDAMGILICKSGQGMCFAANKVKGIRAALAWNEQVAKAARNDDDANILCLAADYISVDEAKKIVQTFLATPFAAEERFVRRINKVKKIEANL